MSALILLGWYLLASAWVAVMVGASTEQRLHPLAWSLLLAVCLALGPWLLVADGWVQVLLGLPVVVAGVCAWPMVLYARTQLERRARSTPAPAPDRHGRRLSSIDHHLGRMLDDEREGDRRAG